MLQCINGNNILNGAILYCVTSVARNKMFSEYYLISTSYYTMYQKRCSYCLTNVPIVTRKNDSYVQVIIWIFLIKVVCFIIMVIDLSTSCSSPITSSYLYQGNPRTVITSCGILLIPVVIIFFRTQLNAIRLTVSTHNCWSV